MFSSLFFASEIPTSVLLIGTLFTDSGSVVAGSSSYYERVAALISRSAGAAPCSSWLLTSALGTVICALDRCTLFYYGRTCGRADGSADPLGLQRHEVIVWELVGQQVPECLLRRLPLAIRGKCDPFYLGFHRRNFIINGPSDKQ
jgi:hypothetical protein